jgi:cobalt-zinc-cadmium efflux system membrane fusion protein
MRRLVPLLVLAVVGVGAFLTRDAWLPWLSSDSAGGADAAPHEHGAPERVKISAQARANLKLVVKPIQTQSYWRVLQVPAEVVERRGRGDQSFTAPVTGVVKSITSFPGDTVEPGAPLLTLRLTSEAMQTSQTELFKAAKEIEIAEGQKKRLEAIRDTVSQAQILDVQNQIHRLSVSKKAYRLDLAAKGLTPPQIDLVETGEFIREIVVRAPIDSEAKSKTLLEMQELKVFLGESVQAGQLLGLLSNHQNLYIEGHGFREDTSLLENAAKNGWALSAVFPEEAEGNWSPFDRPLSILYLSNTVDPSHQTLPFYVPLPNQCHEYNRDGKSYRIWRYRPGQRVILGVPVEKFDGVFVLPAAAVAREGPERYVFSQNGDLFDRKGVHVVYEDSRNVAIANDGSLRAGAYIAHNAAAAINRALKAQTEEGGGGHTHEH